MMALLYFIPQILYQLNQFVGHRSQASSIWWKVTEVTAKITKNLEKWSKNSNLFYKSPSKFSDIILNMVIWRNQNFVRQVTGHIGWWIDTVAYNLHNFFSWLLPWATRHSQGFAKYIDESDEHLTNNFTLMKQKKWKILDTLLTIF